MKINQKNIIKLLLGVSVCILVLSGANCTEKHSSKNVQNFTISNINILYSIIGPNIADLTTQYQKTIKPFIEKPFIPTEVDKLQEQQQQRKRNSNISMTNAILVGPKDTKKGQEKPTMYSTVIDRHPTVIRHQTPQPVHIGVHEDTTRAMAIDPAQTLADAPQNKGGYSIPIKITNGAIKDPTLSGYETPNFISKGEKKIQETVEEKTFSNVDPAIFLKKNMEKDIGEFVAKFENSSDKKQKIQTLMSGKKALHDEMVAISKNIQNEIKELLFAKEVALKLSNLNNYYTTKIRRDQLSSLKLSDVITIKNALREKIHKEIQGFRTAPTQYAELDKANPSDIQIILKNIKLALGQ